MQLEDHVGDVVSKARSGLGLTADDLALIAGLSAADYQVFEESGQASKAIDWEAIAGRLGLPGGKLKALVEGWVPKEPDLEPWRELRSFTTSRGMAVNNYLIWDEVTRDAALFDTGWEVGGPLETIEAEGLTLRYLFITHGHSDHLAGLETVRDRFPKVKIRRSAAEAPVDQRNRANDFLHLGSLRITNRATPGHSADGVTYVVGTWPEDAPNVALVGDALFAGSMGGAASAWDEARRSLREQILTLPSDTLLCPGHGPMTTVAEERAHNPFF